jgi:hypothetical protein
MKFRDCCRYSITPLSKKRIDRLIALIANLENEISECERDGFTLRQHAAGVTRAKPFRNCETARALPADKYRVRSTRYSRKEGR